MRNKEIVTKRLTNRQTDRQKETNEYRDHKSSQKGLRQRQER